MFVPGKDGVIVDGKAGYVVSYGDMLYRSWDAVLRCRQEGLDVGLINKPTLNLVDEQVCVGLLAALVRALIDPSFILDHSEDRRQPIRSCCRVSEPEDRRKCQILKTSNDQPLTMPLSAWFEVWHLVA